MGYVGESVMDTGFITIDPFTGDVIFIPPPGWEDSENTPPRPVPLLFPDDAEKVDWTHEGF